MSSRRQEILEIARREFAQNGYQQTSMRTLADACGLMAGSLYSHFPSKAAVVEEIVLTFYDELIPAQQEALRSAGTGAERLATMIDAVYRVCAAHDEELTILHYDWRTLARLDELSEVIRRSEQTLLMWETVVAEGVADASLRADADPRALMRIITSAIHGLLDFVRHEATRVAIGAPDEPAPGITETSALLQHLVLGGLHS